MPLNASHIYPAKDPDQTYFPSRRSVVHSLKGICTSTQTLASQAGVCILNEGGNAADAAVAMAAVLNVTEPSQTGIGGDIFCLFYNGKTKKISALNGSGRTGKTATLEQIKEDLALQGWKDGQKFLVHHVHAVTVPGAAAGWADTVENFGSGKLTLEQVLTPAIEMAEQGFPVAELTAYYWQAGTEMLQKASRHGHELLKKDPSAPNGVRAPKAGEIMKMPTLANTFRLLAKHGKKGFYEGTVANAVINTTKTLGGRLTLDDLKNHAEQSADISEPISYTYRGQGVNPDYGGVKVWEHPPNGQGLVALMALGILEEMEKAGKIKKWGKDEHNSVEHLHATIEALRIAFADCSWYIADPAVVKVPVKELISSSYLAERAKLFDPKKASTIIDHGSPAHNHCDTVYLSVTDSEGNGCSFINSVYGRFGAGIVPEGTGFNLQNRGANFELDQNHPNAYAPNKRPYHTIIPAMITNPSDGSLHSVYGVMGGFMQPQGHVQVLLNMEVFSLTPQSAVDAPRFCIGAGTPDVGKVLDRTVYVENGIKQEVVDKLREYGHEIEVVTGYQRGVFGRGQVIRTHYDDGQAVYSAGSDPRGDGAAIPVI